MSQQAKAYPTDANTLLLLCDDIRQELGGKLTLMGYMPGASFKLGPVTEPGIEMLQSLALLVVFQDGAGDFQLGASLTDPQGVNRIPTTQTQLIHKNDDGTMNVNLTLRPFPVQLGTYRLTVSLDDRKYTRSFVMERGE